MNSDPLNESHNRIVPAIGTAILVSIMLAIATFLVTKRSETISSDAGLLIAGALFLITLVVSSIVVLVGILRKAHHKLWISLVALIASWLIALYLWLLATERVLDAILMNVDFSRRFNEKEALLLHISDGGFFVVAYGYAIVAALLVRSMTRTQRWKWLSSTAAVVVASLLFSIAILSYAGFV